MNTNLCQLGTGCFGCCGHGFAGKKEISSSIEKNTKEFEKTKDSMEFLKMTDEYIDKNGLCPHIIKKEKIHCPLHPSLNGTDLRKNGCDVNHLCITVKEFEKMAVSRKKAFVNFLIKKNLDFYEYSIKMDNGQILKEFEENNDL